MYSTLYVHMYVHVQQTICVHALMCFICIYTVAAQMWCLCRLLPLMIGYRVSKTDRQWLNFIQLLEIIDIVFAPVISKDTIAYLRVIIEEHHESFIQLYPHCNVTPKMHYMVHYPQWISRYVSKIILHMTIYIIMCI